MTMPGPNEYHPNDYFSLEHKYCYSCGKNLDTAKVQGHYGSCNIGKLGYANTTCTCGLPGSKEYFHKYDGTPCKWLFVADV